MPDAIECLRATAKALADNFHKLKIEIERLRAANARLRLERDVLALNPTGKDPVVFVVSDEQGEVLGVTWKSTQSGSERPIRFPSYYSEVGPGEDQ